jgi:hypothetical protein
MKRPEGYDDLHELTAMPPTKDQIGAAKTLRAYLRAVRACKKTDETRIGKAMQPPEAKS